MAFRSTVGGSECRSAAHGRVRRMGRRSWCVGALSMIWPTFSWSADASGVQTDVPTWLWVCRIVLLVIVVLLMVYSARHYWFTLTRMFRRQSPLHAAVEVAAWPRVVVFIAAHNEEAVIADCIKALLRCDYPQDRILLMPINDRSTDRTREIIDRFVAQFPDRIRPFHRNGGKPGKAAALKEATDIVAEHDFLLLQHPDGRSEAEALLEHGVQQTRSKVEALREATALVSAEQLADLILVFDADYLPSRQLIKQLVAPFFDPEVGAVMGRVVPQNAGTNLLTRILDLERSAGYQVDQQARYCLGAVPQYGGTVGGVRLSALADVGGWHIDMLAEDTDLTYRLLLKGWHTAYLNQAECYEEVPESWAVRFRQIGRWAKGHNQVMLSCATRVVTDKRLPWMQRLDGLALLGVYFMSTVLLLGWLLSAVLVLAGGGFSGSMGWDFWLLFVMSCITVAGNFAAFVQVAAAVHLDGHHERIRLLPVMFVGFLVSLFASAKASLDGLLLDRLFRRELKWDKTVRYRQPAASELASPPGRPS